MGRPDWHRRLPDLDRWGGNYGAALGPLQSENGRVRRREQGRVAGHRGGSRPRALAPGARSAIGEGRLRGAHQYERTSHAAGEAPEVSGVQLAQGAFRRGQIRLRFRPEQLNGAPRPISTDTIAALRDERLLT